MILKTSKLQTGMKLFTLVILAAMLVAFGEIACTKKAEEQAQSQADAASQVKNEYEGTVKVGLGKYLYVPQAQGFDILVEGQISPATMNLAGKTIRVKGNLMQDKPSIYVADSIDLKDGSTYRGIFTRSADPTLPDFLDSKTRDTYESVQLTNINKSEEWEGKTKIKVYGKLETGDINYILVYDANDKEVGRIIVDKISDYAAFYQKKLRLFDKHVFYLNVKQTVERKLRTQKKEMFHADVVYTGLY